jgi:hypothetical protein
LMSVPRKDNFLRRSGFKNLPEPVHSYIPAVETIISH